MAEMVLETDRLVLRPPAADDLPWIQEHMNTPGVMQFLGGAIRSPEEVAAGLEADLAAFDGGGHRRWTVWLRDEDCRIGRCGLFHVRSDAAPENLRGQNEIGWTFAENFQGRGYVIEAAKAVLGFAFEELRFPIVYSQTSESNVPSTRMMVRLGLKQRPELGYFDPDYPPRDNPTTVWSLHSQDWRRDG